MYKLPFGPSLQGLFSIHLLYIQYLYNRGETTKFTIVTTYLTKNNLLQCPKTICNILVVVFAICHGILPSTEGLGSGMLCRFFFRVEYKVILPIQTVLHKPQYVAEKIT